MYFALLSFTCTSFVLLLSRLSIASAEKLTCDISHWRWLLQEYSSPTCHADRYGEESNGSQHGVDIYVVDSGINTNHNIFESQAIWGTTIPPFEDNVDWLGHGTHCAGIIAQLVKNIHLKPRLIAVKVFGKSLNTYNVYVLRGVQWALKNHFRLNRFVRRRSVINISLASKDVDIRLDRVVEWAVRSGIHVVVAAGNNNADACDYSPARAKGVITVGSVDRTFAKAVDSNYGSCVDVFALGVNITSAWINSNDAMKVLSGTSMAAPYVAAVLAVHLSETEYTPQALKDKIVQLALTGYVKNITQETPNKLVF